MADIKFIVSNIVQKIPKWSFVLFYIVIGFIGGWTLKNYFFKDNPLITKVQAVRQGGYDLINPLLFYDVSNNADMVKYEPLRKDISQFIENKIHGGDANKISVYFRGITINPSDKYSPASLMKVPTMIGILKYAEMYPAILSRRVFYDGGFDYNRKEAIKPLKQIQAGESYTIDELLTYMIGYSDNNAAELLYGQLDPQIFQKVFTDLNLSTPPEKFNSSNFDYMDVKSYASFFRVLYNSTYLSREMSQKALKLLLYNDFPQGIEAGIPESIDAAQKFGETTIIDKNNKVIALELHDCGLVYNTPSSPYLLCVMTSGSNFITLENIISSISSMVYQGLNKK